MAENFDIANRAARAGGWNRGGAGFWLDEAGGRVKFIGDVRCIEGYDRGTICYLGPGWRNTGLTDKDIMIRGFIRHDL